MRVREADLYSTSSTSFCLFSSSMPTQTFSTLPGCPRGARGSSGHLDGREVEVHQVVRLHAGAANFWASSGLACSAGTAAITLTASPSGRVGG